VVWRGRRVSAGRKRVSRRSDMMLSYGILRRQSTISASTRSHSAEAKRNQLCLLEFSPLALCPDWRANIHARSVDDKRCRTRHIQDLLRALSCAVQVDRERTLGEMEITPDTIGMNCQRMKDDTIRPLRSYYLELLSKSCRCMSLSVILMSLASTARLRSPFFR